LARQGSQDDGGDVHWNVGHALVSTQGLLVAGIAGGDVTLWEPTQGAAVTAQVYVAAADQPLTSSSDVLRVHEFHQVLIGPGISTGPRWGGCCDVNEPGLLVALDVGSNATAGELHASSSERRFSARETSRSALCGARQTKGWPLDSASGAPRAGSFDVTSCATVPVPMRVADVAFQSPIRDRHSAELFVGVASKGFERQSALGFRDGRQCGAGMNSE